jgi:hypothetical protein
MELALQFPLSHGAGGSDPLESELIISYEVGLKTFHMAGEIRRSTLRWGEQDAERRRAP